MRNMMVASALTLAACGSGGGSGSSGVPVVTAPSPTPTPPSTGTPPATGTPTPAPTYSAVEFGGDRRFGTSLGVQLDTFVPRVGGPGAAYSAMLAAPTAAITLDFTARSASGRFSFSGNAFDFANASLGNGSGSPLLRAACADPLVCDLVVDQGARGTSPIYAMRVIYRSPIVVETRDGIEGNRRVVQIAIIGAPTVPSDLSATTQRYTNPILAIGGSNNGASFTDDLSVGRFTIDANGTVQGSVARAGGLGARDPLLLQFVGTFDRTTNRLSGTITGTEDATISGSFSGQLFGPQGAELGLIFRVTRSRDAGTFVGTLLAPSFAGTFSS